MYERTVLPNGVRIVTEFLPYVRSVTLGAWFDVGSRHEAPTEQGVAHFLEHMLFQSTAKYSAQDIAEIMDRSGSYFNAFTGRERTCFYFKVLDEYWPIASDVMQQMLLQPLFLPEEIAKERQVVLEELKMYEDDPEDQVQDLLPKALWPTSSLGNSILGTVQTVNSFDRATTESFFRKHYTADRLVIAAVGNIRHSQVVDDFASAFTELSAGPAVRAVEPPSAGTAQRVLCSKSTQQIHLCLGRTTFSRTDPRRHALRLLDTLVGGAASSILFQELREKRGLVYNTYSFNALYSDAGCCGIYAGFSPEQWNQVWDVIHNLFTELPSLITEEMLTRAQDQLRAGILLALESTESRMMRLGRAELNGAKSFDPERLLRKIAEVKYSDLIALAEEVFMLDNWSSIALGPKELLEGDVKCQKIC